MASKAMFVAPGALERQVSDLKFENQSFLELSQELMQKFFLGSHREGIKNLDRLYPVLYTGMLEFSLQVDELFVSWLEREVCKLRFDGDTLTDS